MTSTEPGPLLQTPSQTVGPYFAYGLPFEGGPQLVPAADQRAVVLHGTVYDGDGVPIPDALLELWQPDEHGRLVPRAGSRRRELGRFTGFGRAAVEVDGHYEFVTVLPGAVAPSTLHWASIAVFARGLMHHLFTRAYFVETDAPVPSDAVLDAVDPARRETLMARAEGPGVYRFDIHLQGDGETVFLDYTETPATA